MYGTVALLRAKAGMEHQLIDFYDRWYADRRPHQEGWQESFLYQSAENPREFALVGAYSARELFEAGTSGSAAEPWIQAFYDCLEGEFGRVTGDVVRRDSAG